MRRITGHRLRGGRRLLAGWLATFILPLTLHALPTTSVLWGNTGNDDPDAAALRDVDAATRLTAGSTADGDGAILVLGYFTGAATTANFEGAWVPLTGPQAANVPFRATTIGDNFAGTSGAFGFFSFQTDFDQANSATFQNVPPAGACLAVAIFNRATFPGSTHCTIATNDAWRWKNSSLFPDPVLIDLSDPGTLWFGGASSAFVTAVPVADFPGFPVITGAPASRGLDAGAALTFSPQVSGAEPLALQWYKNGTAIPGATTTTLSLDSTNLADAGTYVLRAATPAGVAETSPIRIDVHNTKARLLNLSTRGFVGTGNALLIPGFIVTGAGEKTVLVRAVGPTLGAAPYNVPGVLANPQLSIHSDANVELPFNDDWRTQPGSDTVVAAMLATGAFPLPDDSLDAALVFNAPAGQNLSVHVNGVDGGTGVAIAEIYVIDDAANPAARLINLSTRGFVGTGDNVLIPGFYLGPGGTRRLLIRAAGPTLGTLDPGLTPILADPVLRVRRTSNQEEVAFNDDWQDDGQGPAITAATTEIGAGFQLGNGLADAAVILTVDPSAAGVDDRGFTIEVFDAAGGSGLVLAEIYELP